MRNKDQIKELLDETGLSNGVGVYLHLKTSKRCVKRLYQIYSHVKLKIQSIALKVTRSN